MIVDGTVKPKHVPDELVRDLDFYDLPGSQEDFFMAWKRVLDEYPRIFWTPHYGGTWVITQAEDVARTQVEHEIFSMTSHGFPRNMSASLPVELDPPTHGPVRAIINPLFAPGLIRKLEDTVRHTTQSLINDIYSTGECDFIEDFAQKLPIVVFLELVELPISDRKMLLDWAHRRTRGSHTSEEREAVKREFFDYIENVIANREANPGGDVLSKVIHGKVNGLRLSHEDLRNLLFTVTFGGLDTVSSLLGFVARHLALDPKLRKLLVDNPDQLSEAADELIRRNPVQVGGRLIMKDFEWHGIKIKMGDRLLVPTVTANLDDRLFPDPLEVQLSRPNKSMMHTFGGGPHRCPGANLAKMELRTFLREWLNRIPNFELDPADPPIYKGGNISALVRLKLKWDPKT